MRRASWHVDSLSPASSTPFRPGWMPAGQPMVDGSVLGHCESSFPQCHVPLGQVLQCMVVAQNNPAFILADEFAPCRPIQHCLWGMRIVIRADICGASKLDKVP